MASQSVVVVGAGQAGLETAAALRGRGYEGRITLIGDEPAGPCDRPPLSKGYLAGNVPAGDIALRPASFYAAQDIELLSGDKVASLDRERRTVLLESACGCRTARWSSRPAAARARFPCPAPRSPAS